jgi:hypothetical protein
MWGNGGIVPPFLTVEVDVNGQVHSSAALSPDKSSHVTHWIRACLHAAEQRKILPLSGIKSRSSSP